MEDNKNKKILTAENISKTFGGLKALNNVSFSVEQGSIFGIVGPNGAGKTTLFNIISGMFKPSCGKVFFNNKNTTNFPAYKMAITGIGRTFQVVRPFSSLNVLENVMTAYGSRFYYGAKIFGKWKKDKYIREVEIILKKTGLFQFKDIEARTLPLGVQRKLEMARAIAVNPKLILLDESFSGLSFSEMDELKRLVTDINNEHISVLMIEHNMPVVMDLCHDVMVLNHGEKLTEGSPEEIISNPDVIEAYLGKSHA